MPNRLIRCELLESQRWLTLKDNADRLAYLSLLLLADDYGNYSAERFRLMRHWREFGISTVELVAKSLEQLMDNDLVRLYEVDGKPLLHLPRFKNMRTYWTRIFPKSPFDEQKHIESKQQDTRNTDSTLAQSCLNLEGREGVGKGRVPPSARKRASPPSDGDIQVRRDTWSAYSGAYEFRHGVPPIQDARANSSIKAFCKSVPAVECAAVASFYVQSNNSYYLSKLHPPTLLAADAAKLRTEWATGRQISQTEAQMADKTQARKNVFQPLIDEAKQREKQRE